MNELDLITTILDNHLPTISNIKILKAHIHGREGCPHYQVQFEICPAEPISIYPVKDTRFNNLLEKITILPSTDSKTKISAQINIQTFERSFEILKKV